MRKLLLILVIATIFKVRAHNLSPRDAFDDAELLLEAYATTVAEIADNARQILNRTQTELSNTAEAIKSIGTRILTLTNQGWTQELDEMGRNASEAGVDASSCITMAKWIITAPLNMYTNDLILCVNGRLRESGPLFTEIFTNLDNVERGVQDYQGRIEECRAANDATCLLIVVGQIQTQNELLPQIVDSDVEEVLDRVSNAEAQYQDCTVAPIAGYNEQGPPIIKNARDCISFQG